MAVQGLTEMINDECYIVMRSHSKSVSRGKTLVQLREEINYLVEYTPHQFFTVQLTYTQLQMWFSHLSVSAEFKMASRNNCMLTSFASKRPSLLLFTLIMICFNYNTWKITHLPTL